MFLIGLTGSIGMGKSTTLRMFEAAGCAIFDADAAVKRLYAPGGAAVEPVAEAFPQAKVDGRIDKTTLAEILNANPERFYDLEQIVHPLVRQDRLAFTEQARKEGFRCAIFDIPLLYESGYADIFDKIVVVTAPKSEQRRRVLARPGMTSERLSAILARQLSDAEKRQRADYVIDTSQGMQAAKDQVEQMLAELLGPLSAANQT